MDLNIEQNRLATFSKWKIPFIDENQLALFGFYYYGPGDMVKCYFCNVEIGMWEEGDDVLTDHLRWSKYCDLICRQPTTNVPINNSLLLQLLPPPPPDFLRHRTSVPVDIHEYHHTTTREGGENQSLFGANDRSMWYNSKFALESERIKSYDDWPVSMSQKPCQLSDAGFYYSGKGDRVICYSCGGGLKDWEQNDDPWEQHAMWYGKCEYVKLMKNNDFIKKMNQKRDCLLNENKIPLGAEPLGQGCSASQLPAESSLRSKRVEIKIEDDFESKFKEIKINDDDDEKKCIVCFENNKNTVFLPCGHVVSCAKCSSSVTKCPACRQLFKTIAKIYF